MRLHPKIIHLTIIVCPGMAAHIPFLQQFMIDHNLHGMSYLRLASNSDGCLEVRTPVSETLLLKWPNGVNITFSAHERQTTSALELDTHASAILNAKGPVEVMFGLGGSMKAAPDSSSAEEDDNQKRHLREATMLRHAALQNERERNPRPLVTLPVLLTSEAVPHGDPNTAPNGDVGTSSYGLSQSMSSGSEAVGLLLDLLSTQFVHENTAVWQFYQRQDGGEHVEDRDGYERQEETHAAEEDDIAEMSQVFFALFSIFFFILSFIICLTQSRRCGTNLVIFAPIPMP